VVPETGHDVSGDMDLFDDVDDLCDLWEDRLCRRSNRAKKVRSSQRAKIAKRHHVKGKRAVRVSAFTKKKLDKKAAQVADHRRSAADDTYQCFGFRRADPSDGYRPLEYRHGNLQSQADALGISVELYQMLRSLEEREISPNDYDVLLELHEAHNAQDTLDAGQLRRFESFTLVESPEARHNAHDLCLSQPTQCTVCLGDLAPSQAVRQLPCGHVFHKHCIDTWLTESAISCPMRDWQNEEAEAVAA